ncbi:uncharacterized protein LOC115211563 isoform X2 [Octopus sinensis]|uniref:Uncharacterized protein LOC115211563 isoform X2 n=1 Tax=Octopus sinensis TaxID=2607531 RepID=A0A7E6ERH3_9MOLL|nr:uncharacterized protein LOC115211563 isoform X2 [Octopus sinensis]
MLWLLSRNSQPNVKAPQTANTCRLYLDPREVSNMDASAVSISNASGLQTDVDDSSSSHLNSPSSQLKEKEQKEEMEGQGGDETETVHTRMFVNEKQREMKQKFEEKQRNEAQKKAILEKMQNKSARELVLKQIADDRQHQKLLHSSPVSANVTSPTTPTALPSISPDLTSDDANQSPLTCNVLIRHPNGQSLRNIFDSDKHLQDVWDYATDYFQEMENMCLIQPFPRRDFTKEDATKSLLELGLCPSVALVLKKTDGSQQAFVSQGFNYQVAFQKTQVPRFLGLSDDDDDDDDDDTIPSRSGFHSWGQGRRLGEEADNEESHREEQDGQEVQNLEPEIHDDEELYELQDDGLLHPVEAFPAELRTGVFSGVGMRLLPEGDPRSETLPEPNTSHMRELAVAAANTRHEHQSRSRSPSSQQRHHHHNQQQQQHQHHHHRHHHHHHHYSPSVPSLAQLCLQYIAAHFLNPKEHTVPLHGLSEQPAQALLDYLRKEKLLKPRTFRILHAFLPCQLQKLCFDSYAYVTNELLYEIRMHTNLVHLSLNSCSLITDSGLQPLTALKKLKTLKLGSCRQLTDNCLTPISALQSLATLVLENTRVTDAGIIQYITDISMHQPPTLKCLNLNRTSCTHKIFGPLTELPKLKVLLLEQTMVSSLAGVEELTQLITLNISHTKVDTDSIRFLSDHQNLKYLSLAHTNNIQGDQALQYVKSLKLKEIKLPSRHQTTDEGILHLSEVPLTTLDLTNYINVGDTGMTGVGKIHSLKVLLLGNTRITDTGMNSLKDLCNLEVLYLDRTKITNASAAVFESFPRLLELSLASTRISSRFLKSQHLNSCVQLERLNLSKTRIDDTGLVCLHLPLLSLLNLDGTRVRPTAVSELKGCPKLQRVTLNNLVTVSTNEEVAADSEEDQQQQQQQPEQQQQQPEQQQEQQQEEQQQEAGEQ